MFPTLGEIGVVAAAMGCLWVFVGMLLAGDNASYTPEGGPKIISAILSAIVFFTIMTFGSIVFFITFHITNHVSILDKYGEPASKHTHPGRNFFRDEHYTRYHPEYANGTVTELEDINLDKLFRDWWSGESHQQHKVQPQSFQVQWQHSEVPNAETITWTVK